MTASDLVFPSFEDAAGQDVRDVVGAAPRRGPSAWLAILLSVAACAGLLTLLFVRNHRYFYVDDRIAETVPKFVDIGRMLLAGQWPWLSTNIVNGGAYAIEYLNGVFNPLNLALCVVLARLDDVALGSFVYVLVHCCILAASGAWAGRTLGLGVAWSTALGLSIGFQPYTILWNATAWSQGLIAFAWFALAVAAAMAFHGEPRRRTGWILLFATYSCLTSGWPITVLVLGFFVGVLVVARLAHGAEVRDSAWLCAWFGAGAICSLVAIVPLLTAFQVAARSSGLQNATNFNVAPLEGLLQAANPAYYGFFNNWGGYGLQTLPHFYAAWFLLPVFVFVKAASPRRDRAALLIALLAGAALSVVLALGPERLLVFRFPTRAIQFVNFFLVLLAGHLVAGGRFAFSLRRLAVMLALLGLMTLNALQADPSGLPRVVAFSLPVLALCLLVWARGFQHQRRLSVDEAHWRATPFDWIVPLGSAGILLMLAWWHPSGRGIDWGFPHQVSSLRPVSGKDYTLFYGNYFPPGVGESGYREYRFATTGLTIGDRQINGYSSVGNKVFRRIFGIDDQGNFPPGAAASFTAVDPQTGIQILELFRVDQIVALRGPMDEELRAALGPGWRRDPTGEVSAVYRHAPYPLPGLVSYVSPGVRLGESACRPTHTRECVRVEASGEAAGEGGRVVFARLWVPGYHATLNGEALGVERHAGLLVSVAVPSGRSGVLALTYRPPGLRLFGSLAALVLLGLLAATWFDRPRRTRSQDDRPALPA